MADDVSSMTYPVRCRWCGCVHDAAAVKVEARYLDCSVWRCPRCNVQIDDRPEGWGGSAIRIAKSQISDDGTVRW